MRTGNPPRTRGPRLIVCLCLCAVSLADALGEGVRAAQTFDDPPLRFERNEGQINAGSEYLTVGSTTAIRFTRGGFVFEILRGRSERAGGRLLEFLAHGKPQTADRFVFSLDFVGSEGAAAIEASEPRVGGGASSLVYRGVWPGVDLALRGTEGRLKYEFHVMPGGDPEAIRLAYTGVEGLKLSDAGGLLVRTAFGEMADERPIVYQTIGGARVAVAGGFEVTGRSSFGFEIGPYDRSQPLVIDPVLAYSTYLGGTVDDWASDLVLDSSGNVYVSGTTTSTDFPTLGPYQAGLAATAYHDVFVTKLAPTGSSLVYSTYLSGTGSRDDDSHGIAVDSTGAAYVTGTTSSTDFPLQNAYQTANAGIGAFVTKLAPSGSSLAYSTYLLGDNGQDDGYGIALDSLGSAYVTGRTLATTFPTFGAYQATNAGGTDGFVTKLHPSGSALSYSTYLGGAGDEWGIDIKVDSSGSAYVTGFTGSTAFPTLGAYQATNAGWGDGYVTKLSPSGSSLAYSTFLGSSNRDEPNGLAIDSSGAAYVTGKTESTDFPVLSPYQASLRGGQDGFVAKLSPAGSSLVYSTYLGGTDFDEADVVAIHSSGSAYVRGITKSTNFPLLSPYQGSGPAGYVHTFVTKLSATGSYLGYSTLLRGIQDDRGWCCIAVDSLGAATVAGFTYSWDFPTKNAYQAVKMGSPYTADTFVTKLLEGTVERGAADYGNDQQDEVGVFRNGMWFQTYSPDYAGVDQVTAFGSPVAGRDSPELGEFGCIAAGGGIPDGRNDIAVLRKIFSTWQVTLSPDWASSPDLIVTFGTTAHKRIATRRLDTNGDGCSDIGVFRNGCFDVLQSPAYSSIGTHVCFGPGTDEPLAADLNGDNRSDLILWRSASSHYTYRLSPGYGTDLGADLGGGDLPLLGDMNGDGIADLGSFKQLYATFRFTHSPDFAGVDFVKSHGLNGDLPIVAEVNGDGVADIGIFRNAIARWWFLCSPGWTSTCASLSFGQSGDVPIYGKPPGMP